MNYETKRKSLIFLKNLIFSNSIQSNHQGGKHMNIDKKELSRLKKELKKKPKMKGINGMLDFGFRFEKAGKKDANLNQLCAVEKGHTTPRIMEMAHVYSSFIDDVYLKAAIYLESLLKVGNTLITEYNIIECKVTTATPTNNEIAKRIELMKASEFNAKEKRKKEILIQLSEIRSISETIDEGLILKVERSENILQSKISKYWKGILSASQEKLDYKPFILFSESEGYKAYIENRTTLLHRIDEITMNGGK